MQVSVIIVNYNTFKITCDCIESVIRCTKGIDYEIILVDNASPDDNPDDFLLKFPDIKLIKSKENGGFAKGNNLGIAIAKGATILLLNSDTYLTEDSISVAFNILKLHHDVGALTVRLTYPDGRLQHTARKFRSIKNELLDMVRPVLLLLPYRKRAVLMLNQYFNGDFDTYCDWVSGAFMMFPKSILEHLPDKKLNERFFMYGEDQLWCHEFLQLGYRSFYVSGTTVIHINNASTAPAKQIQLSKKFISSERTIYVIRNGKSFGFYVFSTILQAKEMARYYIKVIVYKLFKRKL